MKKFTFIFLLFFFVTAANASSCASGGNNDLETPVNGVTISSLTLSQNDSEKTIPPNDAESSTTEEWKLIKILDDVEFYQKRIVCKNSENIILKISNKSGKQASCEVRFTPLLPTVPEFYEVHDIKAGGELKGFCSAEYLTFPAMDEGEFKLEFSVSLK